MKKFILGAEFYQAGNEEEPAFINGGPTHLIDGTKITTLEIPDDVEPNREFILDFARANIELLKNTPPEIIKTKLPKFYMISTTKQFWLHIFQDSFIAQHQIKEEPIFENASLDENLSTELGDSLFIDTIDIFLDFEGNELNGPPDRINFWDSL